MVRTNGKCASAIGSATVILDLDESAGRPRRMGHPFAEEGPDSIEQGGG